MERFNKEASKAKMSSTSIVGCALTMFAICSEKVLKTLMSLGIVSPLPKKQLGKFEKEDDGIEG